MYTCPNCGKTYDIPMNFCTICGASMAAQPNVQQQPESPVEPTTTPAPQYYKTPAPAPAIPTSAKVKSIIGMALSIEGLMSALIGLLYTFIYLVISGYMGFVIGLIFFGVSIPFCLAGLLLSISGAKGGCTWKIAKIGKILGIVGVATCGAVLLISLFGLVLGDHNGFFDTSYYNDFDNYYY